MTATRAGTLGSMSGLDVVDRLRAAGSEVFDGQPVVFAYVFGSQATGRSRPGSDIDIAVAVEDHVGDAERFRLRLTIAGSLAERMTLDGVQGPPVEVVVLNDAPLRLRGRIVRDGRCIYSRDEPRRVAFESRTTREWFDFEPLARGLDVEFIRATAEGRR